MLYRLLCSYWAFIHCRSFQLNGRSTTIKNEVVEKFQLSVSLSHIVPRCGADGSRKRRRVSQYNSTSYGEVKKSKSSRERRYLQNRNIFALLACIFFSFFALLYYNYKLNRRCVLEAYSPGSAAKRIGQETD